MKLDRLLGIVTILLQKDKVTAPELAARFEVSRRTISRDIEEINRAGIPIVTMPGRNGGIAILDGYTVEKALLGREELAAILSGLKGIDSVSERPYLPQAMEKLAGGSGAPQASDVMMIDLASHYRRTFTEKIATIRNAIQTQQCISFHYVYEKGEGERRIEPYRLVYQWSSWYVFGYCLDRADYRLFKLQRMEAVCVDGERYSPRPIPAEKLRFDACFASETIHLKALFHPSVKYRLVDEYGSACYQETQHGMLLFEHDFANFGYLRLWVFSFGDKVMILEPQQLQEERLRQARAILRQEKKDNAW